MFDPNTGLVKTVADNFLEPNGIALSQDGKIGYVGDSAAVINSTLPATVCVFIFLISTGCLSAIEPDMHSTSIQKRFSSAIDEYFAISTPEDQTGCK